MEIKLTRVGETYWNNQGAYNKEMNGMYEVLVPERGNAETINGELIRAINRLYYDKFNNGNCNVLDVVMEECEECGGSGYDMFDEEGIEDCGYCGGHCEVECDKNEVTTYYQKMLDFLYEFMQDKKLHREFEEYLITWGLKDTKRDHIYERMMDSIIYQALITDNKPNPYYNENK
mgnify:FL=1